MKNVIRLSWLNLVKETVSKSIKQAQFFNKKTNY